MIGLNRVAASVMLHPGNGDSLSSSFPPTHLWLDTTCLLISPSFLGSVRNMVKNAWDCFSAVLGYFVTIFWVVSETLGKEVLVTRVIAESTIIME